MIRNPSTFIRRGAFIYRLAQDPEPEFTEEEKEFHRSLEEEAEGIYDKYWEQLPKAYAKIGKAAEQLMQQANLGTHGVEEPTPTKDGVDLVYDIESTHIPDAKLRFDFSSTWLSKMKTFIDEDYSQSFSKLNEVIFEYCNHAFVANNQTQWEDLMKSIALVQKMESREREDLGQFSQNEADRKDYAIGLVQKLLTMDVDLEDPFLGGEISDPTYVINYFVEHKDRLGITEQVISLLQDVLSKIPANEWKEMVEEFEQDLETKDPIVPSRELVEDMVQKLTAHEGYGGKISVDYAPDAKLVVALNAPYPFIYVFDREPGSKIRFLYAAMEFCNHTHVANDEAEAKKLITANLDFAEAYETAANPENEVNTDEAANLQELVTIFQKLTRKEMVVFLSQQYPDLSEEKIEEMLKKVSRKSFKRKQKVPAEE